MGKRFLEYWKRGFVKAGNIIRMERGAAGGKRILFRVWKKIYMKYYGNRYVLPHGKELEKQAKEAGRGDILFSIIVPVYNTQEMYFNDMIASCIHQTYTNWELCIADGSDRFHHDIEELSEKWRQRDKRIKYCRLEENQGISENTNMAMRMAGGDYIVLLDHDDMLHPSALYESFKRIQENLPDFLYSNELVFRGKITNVVSLQIKPDFSFDTLRGNNYICHLCVFSAELLRKAGLFRKAYDGAQDYDMILRLCEKAERIEHIPQILYFWRIHSNSVANDVKNKPYAIDSGRKAVSAHLERMGIKGEVTRREEAPTYYTVHYENESTPRVGIYVKYQDEKNMKSFLVSLIDNTVYSNYFIVICCRREQEGAINRILMDCHGKLQKNQCSLLFNDGHRDDIELYKNARPEFDGDFLVFCDSRVRMVTGDWIEEMLVYAGRKDIDMVIPKIVDTRGIILHSGGEIWEKKPDYAGYFKCFSGQREKEHVLLYDYRESGNRHGHMGRMLYAHNVTVVSALCVMVEKEKYENMNLCCMKAGKNRYDWIQGKKNSNLWTPEVLLHYEGRF